MNFQKLSDKDLYEICKKWGAEALSARRKFCGLLPEVRRREMAAWARGGSWVRKRGFSCVYEFAARLAGMSREQVDEVLRLEKRLVDKPVLREALVHGEVSVNKIARVVSIATVENQAEILGKVRALSSRALEVYVKDFKKTDGFCEPCNGQIMDGLLEPQSAQTVLHVQNENEDLGLTEAVVKTVPGPDAQAEPKKLPVNLDEDIAKELLEMRAKGMDVDDILRKFLRERKEKHEREKQEITEKQIRERDDRAVIGYPAKRHVPVKVRRIVIEEFGDKCAIPGCGKSAENLHHEKGFARDRCHDPRYLKPLCRGHHELAHAG